MGHRMHHRFSLAGQIDHCKWKTFHQHAPRAANAWFTVQGKLRQSPEGCSGRPAKAASQALAYRFVIGDFFDELQPSGSTLEHRDDATLRRARVAVGELLGTGGMSPYVV